jgi:uncharacterized protein YceH (UPF0502 family)
VFNLSKIKKLLFFYEPYPASYSRQQLAIVSVMLLRGPHTPGELRSRTNRLADFDNVEETEARLNKLYALNDEQLVIKLDRESGKRDSRYAHLFSGDNGLQVASQAPVNISNMNSTQDAAASSPQALERITQWEQLVAELTSQLAELKEVVDILSE